MSNAELVALTLGAFVCVGLMVLTYYFVVLPRRGLLSQTLRNRKQSASETINEAMETHTCPACGSTAELPSAGHRKGPGVLLRTPYPPSEVVRMCAEQNKTHDQNPPRRDYSWDWRGRRRERY